MASNGNSKEVHRGVKIALIIGFILSSLGTAGVVGGQQVELRHLSEQQDKQDSASAASTLELKKEFRAAFQAQKEEMKAANIRHEKSLQAEREERIKGMDEVRRYQIEILKEIKSK